MASKAAIGIMRENAMTALMANAKELEKRFNLVPLDLVEQRDPELMAIDHLKAVSNFLSEINTFLVETDRAKEAEVEAAKAAKAEAEKLEAGAKLAASAQAPASDIKPETLPVEAKPKAKR